MEENKEQVVEETTQETTKQVEQNKFKSTDDDSVVKVDLNKPPTPKEEKDETKKNNADDSRVAAEPEDAEPTQEQKEIQP